MARKCNNDLDFVLEEYKSVVTSKYNNNTISSDCSRFISIELDLQSNRDSIMDWLNCAMNTDNKIDNPYGYIIDKFEDAISSGTIHPKTPKVLFSWRKSFKRIVLFTLGQYDADLYLALLSDHSDLEFCQLVAKHAIFCKVDVANEIKSGKIGSNINKNNKGNDYFSWFYCLYQRKQGQSQLRGSIAIDKGKPVCFNGNPVKYDDNTQANLAIKNAVEKGLSIKLNKAQFDGYMVCHIWDDSCHDYHYHTSAFNLVLLPKAIGGLSDYCNAVKQLLQYEAAMRFGVYPKKYNTTKFSKIPKYYKDVDSLWRQPDEHKIAVNNREKGLSPIGL